MNTAGIVLFLVSALAGSYLQAVTGFAMGLLMVAVMGAIIWDRHHGFYRDVRFWISLVCLGFLIGFGATHYW